MNAIQKLIRKAKENKAIQKVSKCGLKFTKTNLGQAVFIPKNTTGNFADKMIFIDEWSREELRAIADYMDAFPNCTIFEDGSGKPCK